MHNRWECPLQRTHYLSNDNVCSKCRCYVCNIALDICGVNSHKWAAPVAVLNWERLRPRVQEWTPFDGYELYSARFNVVCVHTDQMVRNTGVETETVVRYMANPVPAAIWHYLKHAVRTTDMEQLNDLCKSRENSILCYMGHHSYMNNSQLKGNLITTLQWCNGYIMLVVRIRRTAWGVSFLPQFDLLSYAPAPPHLAINLGDDLDVREMYPHQSAALRDMLYVERNSISVSLWKCLNGPPAETIYVQKTNRADAELNIYVRQTGCIAPDGMIFGGLLCNDRGTGKTYVVAALIKAHPASFTEPLLPLAMSTPLVADDSDDMDCTTATAPQKTQVPQTLVVVPSANLLQQWVDELEMLQLRVCVHHGRTRIQTMEDLQAYDVIVTTFDTFRVLWFGTTITIFHQVMFWRVIWDECHRLLQGQVLTRAGIAAVELGARNRWGLTATPDLNLSRTRLYAQLVAGPSNTPGFTENSLLHRFIVFPERYSLAERTPLIENISISYAAAANVMPEVHIHRHAVDLETPAAYEQVMQRVRQIGTRYGGMYLLRVFNNLLATINGISPLKWPSNNPVDENRPELPPDAYECSICLEVLRSPMRSACNHFFCSDCIERWLRTAAGCPLCRANPKPLILCADIVSIDSEEDSSLQPSGAKASFLVAQIESILSKPYEGGEPHRILVFSKYVQMRQLLLNMLGPIATSDVTVFHNGQALVLVMSFLSGSVGLNLMQANHVLLCEPCFRSSTEEQAIGRAARLGQRRVVHVHHVVIKNSIEDTMTTLTRHSRLSIPQAFGLV